MENERLREIREREKRQEKKISENVRVCFRIRESFSLFYLDSYAQIVRFDNSLDGKIYHKKIAFVHSHVNGKTRRCSTFTINIRRILISKLLIPSLRKFLDLDVQLWGYLKVTRSFCTSNTENLSEAIIRFNEVEVKTTFN